MNENVNKTATGEFDSVTSGEELLSNIVNDYAGEATGFGSTSSKSRKDVEERKSVMVEEEELPPEFTGGEVVNTAPEPDPEPYPTDDSEEFNRLSQKDIEYLKSTLSGKTLWDGCDLRNVLTMNLRGELVRALHKVCTGEDTSYGIDYFVGKIQPVVDEWKSNQDKQKYFDDVKGVVLGALTKVQADELRAYLSGRKEHFGYDLTTIFSKNWIMNLLSMVEEGESDINGPNYQSIIDKIDGLIHQVVMQQKTGVVSAAQAIPDSMWNASTGKPTDLISYIKEDFESADSMTDLGKTGYKTFSDWTQRFTNRVGMTISKHRGRKVVCGDFVYSLVGRYLIVLKYKGDAVRVEVPSHVGGVPVKMLHPDFLASNVLPTIDNYQMRHLGKVLTGSSESMYYGSVMGPCSELVLPNTLKCIPIGTFKHCNNLKTLVIPASVNSFDVLGIEETNIRTIFFEGKVPANFRRDRFSGDVFVKVG